MNRKADFFYKTNRFESIRITNRIDSNRELECSTHEVFGLGLGLVGLVLGLGSSVIVNIFAVLSMLSLLQINNTDFSHSLLKYQNLSAKLRHYNQSAFIH